MRFTSGWLSLAVLVITGTALGLHYVGVNGLFVGWVALALAGIVLAASSQDLRAMIRALMLCTLGMMVGLLFCPATDPPHEPGDEFRYMIAGVILTWSVGSLFGHRGRVLPQWRLTMKLAASRKRKST